MDRAKVALFHYFIMLITVAMIVLVLYAIVIGFALYNYHYSYHQYLSESKFETMNHPIRVFQSPDKDESQIKSTKRLATLSEKKHNAKLRKLIATNTSIIADCCDIIVDYSDKRMPLNLSLKSKVPKPPARYRGFYARETGWCSGIRMVSIMKSIRNSHAIRSSMAIPRFVSEDNAFWTCKDAKEYDAIIPYRFCDQDGFPYQFKSLVYHLHLGNQHSFQHSYHVISPTTTTSLPISFSIFYPEVKIGFLQTKKSLLIYSMQPESRRHFLQQVHFKFDHVQQTMSVQSVQLVNLSNFLADYDYIMNGYVVENVLYLFGFSQVEQDTIQFYLHTFSIEKPEFGKYLGTHRFPCLEEWEHFGHKVDIIPLTRRNLFLLSVVYPDQSRMFYRFD